MPSNAPVPSETSTTSAAAPAPPATTRVVVGVDGSPCGAEALTWAMRQAVLQGATLDAVACWQPPAMVSGAAGFGSYIDPSAFDQTEVMTEVLEKALAAAVGDVPGAEDVAVRSRVVASHPARALLVAAEGADLLVVGSRGHGELSGMLLGSVGLHCVAHAPCPVVVVRHPAATEATGD
jgi:nucleotide-binding universal stress UspA family protein